MWPRAYHDPTQHGSTQHGSTRHIQAGTAIFLVFAVVAFGPGYTGKAVAIDLPNVLNNSLKKKAAEKPKGVPAPKQVTLPSGARQITNQPTTGARQITNQPTTGARQILGNQQGGQKGLTGAGPKQDGRFQTGNAALQKGLNPKGPQLSPTNTKVGNNSFSKGLPGNQTGSNPLNNRLGTNAALGKGLPGNATG